MNRSPIGTLVALGHHTIQARRRAHVEDLAVRQYQCLRYNASTGRLTPETFRAVVAAIRN
jgi:hypothetical protein